MIAAEGAPARLRRYNSELLRGRAGVHLQLTGGAPLSTRAECPDLFENDGTFRDPRRHIPPPVEQVEVEWRRQIDTVLAAVQVVSHLDSHHGMHRYPQYFDLYLALAAELGVSVRGPLEASMVEQMRALRVQGSTVLVREWTGSGGNANQLLERISAALNVASEEDIIEVITHAGYVDERLVRVSTMTNTRAVELAALTVLGGDKGLHTLGACLADSRNAHTNT